MNRRPDALAAFDVSLPGLGRSFAAIALTLPAFAVSLALRRRDAGLDVVGPALLDDVSILAIVALAHLASFLALPLAMVPIARRFSLGDRYVPFVVATNWISVFGSLALALPGALLLMNVETGPLAALFTVAFAIIALQAQWFATRVTLGIGAGSAAVLTALGLGFDLAIFAVADILIG